MYIIFPKYVVSNPNLTNQAKHFFAILYTLSGEKGFCVCTNKELSDYAEVSVRQIQRYLLAFRKENLIHIEYVNEYRTIWMGDFWDETRSPDMEFD